MAAAPHKTLVALYTRTDALFLGANSQEMDAKIILNVVMKDCCGSRKVNRRGK